MAVRAGMLAAFLCFGAFCQAVRGADTLVPGADLADCRSALRIGPSTCAESEGSTEAAMPDAPQEAAEGAAAPDLEKRVDAYLAAYGKPPREAVRALLEPSEAHIRDLLRKQEETLAMASFVAMRMTQLQDAQVPRPAWGDAILQRDRNAVGQMRVRLVASPHGQGFHDALRALRGLARELPALQAGVLLVGTFSPRELRAEISRIDPALSVDVAPPGEIEGDALAVFQVDDLRNRRTATIPAASVTSSQLVGQILDLDGARPVDAEGRRVPESQGEPP